MELIISITQDGVKTYPLHSHDNYEIMFYIEGEGYLHNPDEDYPFSVGTAIIIPPGISHGSVSKNGFKNICIRSDFVHLLNFDTPKVVLDNSEGEGMFFAKCIYRNRFDKGGILEPLTETYVRFLLKNITLEDEINKAVNDIVTEIGKNAFDINFLVTDLLKNSGYAEDYIRNCFTKQVGMSPVKFLNRLRINRARTLIDIYKTEISLSDIAERCGFSDYAYFSKKFKAQTGLSPKEYLSNCYKNCP